jgi:hypothetical protein
MVGSEHLTEENVSYLATKPGQAHFARVDTNNTCRECEHWANQRGEKDRIGLLKPARCQKARQHLKNPPPIPHNAIACRHFEASPNPPAV